MGGDLKIKIRYSEDKYMMEFITSQIGVLRNYIFFKKIEMR